ncbi:hypothetical protein FRB90_008962 [Tulasnella sp. 427]|nr:hypothetical protein FRB90_008962 [Tulasnella sp. 427]
MNAMLIWLSPEDAAAGAWASTILTGALVIPALRSKMQRELTLHHATLVLNFSTLSTIASVAAAPMVPIWRVIRKKRGSSEVAFQQEQDERARGRIILSLALGAQIVLQWIWTVLMFVDPFYAQNPCSGDTKIVYIAGVRTADEINQHFGSWAVWLLLCISSSLIFGVVMVFSCTSPVHETPLKYDQIQSEKPTTRERVLHWMYCVRYFLYPKDDEDIWKRWGIRITQLGAFAIVVGFVVLSELQITENNVLSGENEIWSFSQHQSSSYTCSSCPPYYPSTPQFGPVPLPPDKLLSPPPELGGKGGKEMTYDPYEPWTPSEVSVSGEYVDPWGVEGGGGLKSKEHIYMPVPILAVDAASDSDDSTSAPHQQQQQPTPPSPTPSSSSSHQRQRPPPTRKPSGPRTPTSARSRHRHPSVSSVEEVEMESTPLTVRGGGHGHGRRPSGATLSPPSTALPRTRHRSSSSLGSVGGLSDGAGGRGVGSS